MIAPYRQYIVWQLLPGSPKSRKVPIDWRTGLAADAHDPDIWLTAAEAAAAATRIGPNCFVGFVLTKNDPFWFIDIDDALGADGQWSPVAQQLCATFAGAWIERSHSGRGLHIVGSGPVPEHGCKNKAYKLEFYDADRFMALGADGVGDPTWRNDVSVQWLVDAYFKRGALGVEDEVLRGAAVPEWSGPADDAELIRRAMNSKSARSLFGNGASFADLWTANAPVLALAYPSDSGDVWDRSSADMALLQHLAFWTGKHGERMVRLMRQSMLQRPKWDKHKRYLELSAVAAQNRQEDVLHDAAPEPVAASVGEALQRTVSGSTFLSPAQQIDLFRGCVYVTDANAALVPGGDLQDASRFRVTFGGYTFAMDMNNERTVRNAWEAFTESQALRPPRADTTCFKPNAAPGVIVREGGRLAVNAWWPIEIDMHAGNPEPFMQHLRRLLPVERDANLLMSYLAACVQHKGVKFQWAPLLQGVEGNGKTFFSYCVMHAVGMRYSHIPRPQDISSKFNPWLRNKLVIAVEDVYVEQDRSEIFEILKPMITGQYQAVEPKGVDQVLNEIVANFIFNTNHKDGLRKTRNDRRVAPFFCAQQQHEDLARDGLTPEYFASLYAWINHGGRAVVNHLLHTWPIPDEMNPALGGIAPITSSTAEAVNAGVGNVEMMVLEAIEQGVIGFVGGWVSSIALDKLLEDRGVGRRVPLGKRRAMMQSIGYDWHPALRDGRVDNNVMPDNSRPRLFVRAGSPALLIAERGAVARAYTAAQLPGVFS